MNKKIIIAIVAIIIGIGSGIAYFLTHMEGDNELE